MPAHLNGARIALARSIGQSNAQSAENAADTKHRKRKPMNATEEIRKTAEDFIFDSMKNAPMRAVAIEGSDGIICGGVIIVRGEREFDILCAFLKKPTKEIK